MSQETGALFELFVGKAADSCQAPGRSLSIRDQLCNLLARAAFQIDVLYQWRTLAPTYKNR